MGWIWADAQVRKALRYEGPPSYLSIGEWGRCLWGEYVPARKRQKPSALDPAAAMVKRKGDSFPCFIPDDSSQEEALLLELEINPFGKLLAIALCHAEQACVKYNCSDSNLAKRRRRRVIKHMDNLRGRLKPLQRKLDGGGGLPVSAPSRKLSIPLICALATKLRYADKALTSGLVRGMPIVGEIPRTNALPAKATIASMSVYDAKGSVETTNLKILKSLSKSTGAILIQKRCELSWAEFA